MIAASAIEEFLDRPMRDSRVAKRLPEKKLDAMIARVGLDFYTEPRRAQKVCALLGWKHPSYLFLLGCGGGKTKISVDQFRNRRRVGDVDRMLVLVPNVVNLGEWQEEVRKHSDDVSVVALDVPGSKARWAILEDESVDVVVATYAGFGKLVTKVVEKTKGGRKKRKQEWQAKALDRIAELFGMLILDECTAAKNRDSLWFRILRRLRKDIEFCYGLTGTPFDKEPDDLWSQFYLVDFGYTLGETYGLFRETFFREESGYFGSTWTFRKRMWKQLSRRLANASVRFSEEECQDLPPSVGGISGDPMVVPVELPKAQRPYYEASFAEYRDAQGNLALCDAAYHRLRMVCSGWIGAKTEDGEKVELVFPSNPVFDAVADLLARNPDEKVVVVCYYQTTVRLLVEYLRKKKITDPLVINGTTTAKAKERAKEEFKDPAGRRVLIGSTAISKGVNFQGVCRRMIFVESPDSQIERTQIERRILRERAEDNDLPCYFWDIAMRGRGEPLVAEKILQSVSTGRNLHDILIDRKRRRA